MIDLVATPVPVEVPGRVRSRCWHWRHRHGHRALPEGEATHRAATPDLIDTPGHVDFSYEVSRSLAAVETAILLVDSTQGIQAQTLANLYLAMEQNLTIIPVVNKIDLPASDVKKTKQEIIKLLGCQAEDIFATSGKTGEGVSAVLDEVIKRGLAPNEPLVTRHFSIHSIKS